MDTHEQLLTLADAARHLELRGAKRPHTTTIYRWCTRGVNGIVLASLKVGRFRYTTASELEQFTRRVAEASANRGEHPRPPARIVATDAPNATAEIERAHRDLDRAGI